jgi:hypothetical protein
MRIPKRKLIVRNLKNKKGEKLTNLKFSRRYKKRESESVSQSTTPKSKKFIKYSKNFNKDMKNLKYNFDRKAIVMTSPKSKNVVVSITREESTEDQNKEEKQLDQVSKKEESLEEKLFEMESSAEQKKKSLIEVKEIIKKDTQQQKLNQLERESGNEHAGSVIQPQPEVDDKEKPTVEEETTEELVREETAEELVQEKLDIQEKAMPVTKIRKESPDPRENVDDSIVVIKSVDKMSTCKSPGLRENKTLLDSCERRLKDDEFFTESSRKVLTT